MSNPDTTESPKTKTISPNWGKALLFFIGLSIGLIAGESDPIGYIKDKVTGAEFSLSQGELISDCPSAHNVWVVLENKPEAFAGCSFESSVKVEGKKATLSCKEFILPGSTKTTKVKEGKTK
jgi:hypothetical protein